MHLCGTLKLRREEYIVANRKKRQVAIYPLWVWLGIAAVIFIFIDAAAAVILAVLMLLALGIEE